MIKLKILQWGKWAHSTFSIRSPKYITVTWKWQCAYKYRTLTINDRIGFVVHIKWNIHQRCRQNAWIIPFYSKSMPSDMTTTLSNTYSFQIKLHSTACFLVLKNLSAHPITLLVYKIQACSKQVLQNSSLSAVHVSSYSDTVSTLN